MKCRFTRHFVMCPLKESVGYFSSARPVVGLNQFIFLIHQPADARDSAYAFEELSVLPNRRRNGFGHQVTRADDRRTCLNWEVHQLPMNNWGSVEFSGGSMTP